MAGNLAYPRRRGCGCNARGHAGAAFRNLERSNASSGTRHFIGFLSDRDCRIGFDNLFYTRLADGFFDWCNPTFTRADCSIYLARISSLVEFKKTNRESSLSNYKPELISGILIYGAMLVGIWAAFSWLPTWVQSLESTDSTIGQAERGLAMGLLGIGGMIGGIVSGFFANIFGQKNLQAICFVISFLLSYWLFQMNTTYNGQIPAGIAILGFTFGVSQGVLNTYIPELFPAAIRSAATGLSFNIGRVFTATAVFFVGVFVTWFGSYGNAIFAFSGVYILGLLAMLLNSKSSRIVRKELLDSEVIS